MSRHAHDRGFTVAELSVVLALIGVMLAVTYTGMKVVYDAQRASDNQAWFAREIGQPLDELAQVLSQNTRIDSATTQTVTVLVDRPRKVGSVLQFDCLERHTIAPALTAGTGRYRLADTVHGTDELWNPTVVVRSVTWTDDLGNTETGTPLFVFLDRSGAEVAPQDAATQATQARVTIVSKRNGRLYKGSRIVAFRNR